MKAFVLTEQEIKVITWEELLELPSDTIVYYRLRSKDDRHIYARLPTFKEFGTAAYAIEQDIRDQELGIKESCGLRVKELPRESYWNTKTILPEDVTPDIQ